jgi:hypothetical protein
VANLWTKFTAFDRYAMAPYVKECENPNETLVAATFEKAKLTFLRTIKFGTVRSEVRILSPRPLIPIPSNTYGRQHWRLVFWPWQVCGRDF